LGEKGVGCEVCHYLPFSAELRMNGDVFPLAPQAYITCKRTSIITRNNFDQNIIFWKYPVFKVTFYDKRNNFAAFNLETKF